MQNLDKIIKKLEECGYKFSTDTRVDLKGSVYFALKGENFDGNKFVHEALKKGAILAVTDNPKNKGKNIYLVKNTLETLQKIAGIYRDSFSIPIIVIGGSNGKTTSKELLCEVLKTRYKVHATVGSLNNHIGVPISILSMNKNAEIGLFEIGANHPLEHTELLKILKPTHVVVTNNGMDHLEGFKTPRGARMANKEIYDWAKLNKSVVFVDKNQKDLMFDSKNTIRKIYPLKALRYSNSQTLSILFKNKKYKTNLTGNYNIKNINLAFSIGKFFNTNELKSIKAICAYKPNSKRSQFIKKDGNNFVVDCYNANPTSMKMSIDSFLDSTKGKRGLILGDMLELGKYSKIEHQKILKYISSKKLDLMILIGENFKKVLKDKNIFWFEDSEKARKWFIEKKFKNHTFLLKGSRGIKVEKIIE